MFFKKNTTVRKRTLMEAVHAESNIPLFCSLQDFQHCDACSIGNPLRRSDFNYKLDGHRHLGFTILKFVQQQKDGRNDQATGTTYFVVCTFLTAANFIGMTIHSHTRFAEITNEDKLTPEERLPIALLDVLRN